MKTTYPAARSLAPAPSPFRARDTAPPGVPYTKRYANARAGATTIHAVGVAVLLALAPVWRQPAAAAVPTVYHGVAPMNGLAWRQLATAVAISPSDFAAVSANREAARPAAPSADSPATSPPAVAPAGRHTLGAPRDTTPTTPLTLGAALRAALAHHPRMAAADAVLDGAAAGLGEAAAARLPSLGMDGTFMRYGEPMVTAPLHGFNPLAPPAFDRTLLQGGISLGYTIYDGGARSARVARAEALTGAGEAGVVGARQALIGDVVRAYLRVLTAGEVLEGNEKRVRALEEERGRAAQLLERGTAARVLVLRAEAALGAARAEWHAARGELDLAVGELSRLTGLDASRIEPASLIPVRLAGAAHGSATAPNAPASTAATTSATPATPAATPSSTTMQPSLDRAALLARALAANPEITRLQRHVAAAEATRAEARSLWFPTIQAVGRYAEYASGLGREQGEWQGGIQFSLPLFTGGARQAAGARADAELRSARARLALARLELAASLDRAIAAVETERARADALRAAAEQAEEVVRIERLALDAGAGVQTDYLAAEAELLRVRAAWSAARAAEIAARVELARITGELSIEWLEQNLEPGS